MSDEESEGKGKKTRKKLNLANTMLHLNKEYGEGTMMVGREAVVNVNAIPTEIAAIDSALGVGGFPEGRIIEIFGPESCGKTTIALLSAAAFQARKKKVVYVDAEHSLDPEWAARLGVDTSTMILSQPDSGESAMEIIRCMAETGEIGLIVLDSVAALVPQAELDGEIGDVVMAGTARIMSKGLRVLKGIANNTGCVIIFINQIREKVGFVMGSSETTPGGRALKFYASCRIRVSRGEAINRGTKAIGHVLNAKIVKNKVASPFKTAKVNIYYGDPVAGVDKVECLFAAAKDTQVLKAKGSYFWHGETRLANGGDNTLKILREDPALLETIRKEVYDHFKKGRSSEELTDEELLASRADPDAVEEEFEEEE